MNKYGWADAATMVRDFVVKIEAPDSYGTGFLINYKDMPDKSRKLIIATAYHVVEHADKWFEVIKIKKDDVEVPFFPQEREVLTLESRDLALVVIDAIEGFTFPDEPLAPINTKEILPPGFPVGWCGYPNIADDHKCFFAGHLSAPIDESGDYFVDGVVIHGVSGGPAFIHVDDHVSLIGLISAYLPNRVAGDALPGMTVVRSVNPFTEFFAKENRLEKKRVKRQEQKTASRTKRGAK